MRVYIFVSTHIVFVSFLKCKVGCVVEESKIKLGLNFLESIPITHNNTCLVVGEIKIIDYDKNYMDEGFEDGVGVVGLNSYFGTNKIKDLDYYRVKK